MKSEIVCVATTVVTALVHTRFVGALVTQSKQSRGGENEPPATDLLP